MRKNDTDGERERATHVIGSCFDLLVQFVLVFIPERRVTHQQNVQDHTWDRRKDNTLTKMLLMITLCVFVCACTLCVCVCVSV